MYTVHIQTKRFGSEYKQVMFKSGTLYDYENKASILYVNLFPTELNGLDIKPTVTKIKVLDHKGNEVFWGRLINNPVRTIQADGTFYIYLTAESAMNFLIDRVALKWEFHPETYTEPEYSTSIRDKPVILENQTVKTALSTLINVHYNGAKEEEQIHYSDDNVTVEDSVYFTTQRSDTILSVIQNKIIKNKGGYMTVKRADDGLLYLYYSATNDKVGPDIVLGDNIMTFNQSLINTPYYNRVTATGANGLTMTGRLGGGPVYVNDATGENTFGIRETFVEFPDVTDPNNLYSKASQYLIDINKAAQSSFDLQVLDKSFLVDDLGYEISQVCKINCSLINGIQTTGRIIEISRALESPYKVRLTLTKRSPSAIANNVDTEIELQNLKSQIQSLGDRI